MTTDYEKQIRNLLYLLQNRPDLFANLQAERQALSRDLPDDMIQAANAATLWCKTHPDIYTQLLILSNAEGEPERGVSGSPSAYDPKDDKGLLNQLRISLLAAEPSSPPQ
jgi:hypothetical protein